MPRRRVQRRHDRDDQRSQRDDDQRSQRHDALTPSGTATAVAERVPVQRLHLAMNQPASARPADLVALQRVGGNRALAQRLAATGQNGALVHRTLDEDIAAGFAGGGGAVEPLSGGIALGADIGQGAGSTGGFANWQNPNADPVGSTAQVGVSGSSIGGAMQIVGLGLASKGVHQARKDRTEAIQQGKKTKAREADRRLRTGGADVGTRAYGVVSSTVDATARGVGIAAQTNTALSTTASALGAGAAGVAIPLTAFQAGRDLRKAIKAGERVKRLNALKESWDTGKSKAVIETLTEKVTASDELVNELVAKDGEADTDLEKLARAVKALIALQPNDPRRARLIPTLREKRKELADLKASIAAELVDARKELLDSRKELADARTAKAAMEQALQATEKAGHSGDVTLEMIQAYAYKKNNRGVIKKAISFVGGALGLGAGIAALVASIAIAAGVAAGASVLMATPVGWGLAAAAAAIGLGLGIYKAVRFFSKRWKQTEHMKDAQGQALSKKARLGKTLAFWRSTGKSKREEYGEALWKMANKGNDKAKDLIKALGLDWVALDMGADMDNAVKLIAAKLAS